MKTIGLIGGISWQSTLVYYSILNELAAQQLGDSHSCKCIINSVQFAKVKKGQLENDWDSLNELMADAALSLQRAGADLVLIGANTMHLTAPYVQQKIDIPLIHIVDVVGEKIEAKGLKTVALLGTQYTMKKDFYKKHLKQKFDAEVLVPDGADFDFINEVIYKELVKGVINQASKQQYINIMQKLIDQGAEGVILGCTEIPLLVQPTDCTFPVFDTTRLHAEAAIAFAL